MKRLNARARADLAPLTVASIRKVVLSMYHRRHDYWTDADIAELPPELAAFNITTVKQLRLLMKRHRRALLQEERARMPRALTLGLLAEWNPRSIDVHANTCIFAIGALVRVSMEHEFGFETMLPFHEIREDETV
ncbi:TPA: hypothetical protein QDZ42_000570 [Stenotrophomonas maltophilia]|nr:hypothetical protein [Stenotrophomonas maltophilia]HDS1041957.1 hypothetical protein [Stenotrophomonas maltophilia]